MSNSDKTSKNKARLSMPGEQDYLEELKSPWKTMQQDIAAALAIINSETDMPFTQISFIKKVEQCGNTLEFSFPDWHMPVESYFVNQYGKEEGSYIFDKVVIQLFKRARGTQVALH